MPLTELTKSNFKEVVGVNKIVLISCWAPGCGVCLKFDPVFEKVSKRFPDHVFARMNVLTEEKLGEYFGIEHTPALMLYRDSLLLLKKPGVFSDETLADMIGQMESLDMNVVRKDIAAEETAEKES